MIPNLLTKEPQQGDVEVVLADQYMESAQWFNQFESSAERR